MSYDEVIYRIDKFPSIETDCIHIKDYDCCNYNTDETLKIKKKFVTRNIYKEKKTVRFPDESKIVSAYFEATNYWQERRFCSSSELLTSYKRACECYNIKPIPILLEQISGIDVRVNNGRFDMLNLSNIKLDLKNVECIEEVLKRVQFITLNFSNITLDDNAAVSLFEIIEYYESCLNLNISLNCKMSCVGFNALSKMLKKIVCLHTLELRGIYFIDSTMPSLNKALRGDSYLRVLHLENSNITSKNLLILTSALKLNFHLRELHLSGNRMVQADGIQLGSLLRVNTLLETLDLRNNLLGVITVGL